MSVNSSSAKKAKNFKAIPIEKEKCYAVKLQFRVAQKDNELSRLEF